MARALKLSLPAALLLAALVVFAFAACGKGVGRGSLQAAHFVREQPIGGLETAAPDPLTDLDALACPDGVDASLWSELKAALEEALISKEESRLSSRDLEPKESRLENRDSFSDVARFASTPPAGEANRVNDLAIADNGDSTYTLTWHYRNLGDYDQNGVVAVEDIIPLAEHFGSRWWSGAENLQAAVCDGSGNMRVGIEDVTPIAMLIGANVDCYTIQGSVAKNGPWYEVSEVPQTEGTGSGRLAYEHILVDTPYNWYRLVPCDLHDIPKEPSDSMLAVGVDEWIRTWGANCGYAFSVTAAADGCAYFCGYNAGVGSGTEDAFFLKYSPSGSILMQRVWQGDANDCAFSITVDELGNIYVAGHTESFGAGGYDSLLLKYSAAGDLIWQRAWGGKETETAREVVVDRDGCAYLIGFTMSFGAGLCDIFVLKYSSEGELLWQRTWGGDKWDDTYGAAISSLGDIYIAGGTSGFGAGHSSTVILKYSSQGKLVWQKTWGGRYSDSAVGVAIDTYDNVYIVGDTTSFGVGGWDVLLLKYDPNGNLQWQKTWGGREADFGSCVAIDSDGAILVGGGTYGFNVEYGSNKADAFLLKYSSAGDLVWAKTFGAIDRGEWFCAVDSNETGGVFVTGSAGRSGWLWTTPLGIETSPQGTEVIPEGKQAIPAGTETIPDGVTEVPTMSEDTGGAIMMMLDPSF